MLNFYKQNSESFMQAYFSKNLKKQYLIPVKIFTRTDCAVKQ